MNMDKYSSHASPRNTTNRSSTQSDIYSITLPCGKQYRRHFWSHDPFLLKRTPYWQQDIDRIRNGSGSVSLASPADGYRITVCFAIRGCCDLGNPSKTLKVKSRKMSLAHNLFLGSAILWNDTTMPCGNFQNDRATDIYAMYEWDFARLEFQFFGVVVVVGGGGDILYWYRPMSLTRDLSTRIFISLSVYVKRKVLQWFRAKLQYFHC